MGVTTYNISKHPYLPWFRVSISNHTSHSYKPTYRLGPLLKFFDAQRPVGSGTSIQFTFRYSLKLLYLFLTGVLSYLYNYSPRLL